MSDGVSLAKLGDTWGKVKVGNWAESREITYIGSRSGFCAIHYWVCKGVWRSVIHELGGILSLFWLDIL